ncbi:MAG: DUF1499 domain-containing protein [Pseudomonadota bacterium]
MLSRALLVLGITVCCAACVSPPIYESGGSGLPLCGSLPNCVNSLSGQGGQAIEPLIASQQQWRDLVRFVEKEKDWLVQLQHENFIQVMVVSRLMRFRDDLQLLYYPTLNVVHVRSSSRIGIGDMGANRKRVELLRHLLQESGGG